MKRSTPPSNTDPLLWRVHILHQEAVYTLGNISDLTAFMQRQFGYVYTKKAVTKIANEMREENEHERMVGPSGTDG